MEEGANVEESEILEDVAAISRRITAVPFAGALHVLSADAKKRVILGDLQTRADRDELTGFAREVVEGLHDLLPPGFIVYPSETQHVLSELQEDLEVHSAILAETDTFILIVVKNLDPEWLKREEKDDGVKNADYVHAAIAHEVIGRLLRIERHSHTVGLASSFLAEIALQAEYDAQCYGSLLFLDHVLRHKGYHRVPRHYAHASNRADVLSVCYKAALYEGADLADEAAFKTRVANLLDAHAREKRHDHLRACPLMYGGLYCHEGDPSDPAPKGPVKIMGTCEHQGHCDHYRGAS